MPYALYDFALPRFAPRQELAFTVNFRCRIAQLAITSHQASEWIIARPWHTRILRSPFLSSILNHSINICKHQTEICNSIFQQPSVEIGNAYEI